MQIYEAGISADGIRNRTAANARRERRVGHPITRFDVDGGTPTAARGGNRGRFISSNQTGTSPRLNQLATIEANHRSSRSALCHTGGYTVALQGSRSAGWPAPLRVDRQPYRRIPRHPFFSNEDCVAEKTLWSCLPPRDRPIVTSISARAYLPPACSCRRSLPCSSDSSSALPGRCRTWR